MIISRKMRLAWLLLIMSVPAGTVMAGDARLNSLPLIERPVQQVLVPATKDAHITIAKSALIQRDGIPGVFVVENKEARFRMVRPGKIRAGRVEILSGLHGHEILVTGELESVHDGSPINVISSKASTREPGKK